jgi:hypothetical protein
VRTAWAGGAASCARDGRVLLRGARRPVAAGRVLTRYFGRPV